MIQLSFKPHDTIVRELRIWRIYYVGASLSLGEQLSTVPFFVNGSVISHYGEQWFLGSKSNTSLGTFLLTP